MSDPIKITTLQDFLKVPPERLDVFLGELGLAVHLHWLAFGEKSASVTFESFIWTDDSDSSVTLVAADDPESFLTLKVEKQCNPSGG